MGSGITTGKYARITSSVKKLSDNKYKLTVNLSTSSSLVYNYYGMRVYMTINGVKDKLLGTYYIYSGGQCSPSEFNYDFTINKTQNVGALCVCSYCEDGLHHEYEDEFFNKTSEDVVTYNSPEPEPEPEPTVNKYLKRYDGTKWVECTIKRYDGTKWVECNIKRYDGTKWTITK